MNSEIPGVSVPPRGLRNPPMLRFLSAVAHATSNPDTSLPEAAGLDAMELAIAMAEAKRCGFIAMQPEGVKLMPAGIEWSAAELLPVMPLVAVASQGGLL
ncbi:hypothetical protein [Paenirhodobacter populi]|uniref:hypothetical protein n=1 Tax=Paenirhodobacter populi TaxID=2306993 RepID=UPI000FE3510E|nr:hypothetical protein [Sinirhodobacter populi]RWR09731.1 hypothetical protein D2T32_05140 [Sinirhodobacter populi]